ncbi:MAG: hypothetical protein EXR73_14230 [Myxococcales bacterium]|nr:hypothetical protein [Myxococcales bacterium]
MPRSASRALVVALALHTLLAAASCARARFEEDGDSGPRRDGGGIMLPPDARGAPRPDAASNCDTPCELISQCGCGAGEACDLDGSQLPTGGTMCRPVTTPGTETSTCASGTDCARQYVCLGLTDAQCMRYCASDSDCGGLGLCVIQIESGGVPVPGARVCSHTCQPHVAGGNCPPGWGCSLYQEEAGMMRPFAACHAAGAGGHRATCTTASDCQAAFECYTDGSTFFCLHNCNVTTGVGCATVPGTTCMGFATPVVFGGSEYGYCD